MYMFLCIYVYTYHCLNVSVSMCLCLYICVCYIYLCLNISRTGQVRHFGAGILFMNDDKTYNEVCEKKTIWYCLEKTIALLSLFHLNANVEEMFIQRNIPKEMNIPKTKFRNRMNVSNLKAISIGSCGLRGSQASYHDSEWLSKDIWQSRKIQKICSA